MTTSHDKQPRIVLFIGEVHRCTKYPYKDILVHRCTSQMNKTTHPNWRLHHQTWRYSSTCCTGCTQWRLKSHRKISNNS